MTAANLKLYKDLVEASFVMKDLKKYKDMPALLHTQAKTLFMSYPQLMSKAAQNYLRVDGTPKLEKEKVTMRSFLAERGFFGLMGDAFRLARAWR
jgi:electron transfer flavoprotein-quinone oxidoreductase